MLQSILRNAQPQDEPLRIPDPGEFATELLFEREFAKFRPETLCFGLRYGRPSCLGPDQLQRFAMIDTIDVQLSAVDGQSAVLAAFVANSCTTRESAVIAERDSWNSHPRIDTRCPWPLSPL